ncbi:MAG: hypothetical protein V4481_01355 [Patescibacteria group bacterium]
MSATSIFNDQEYEELVKTKHSQYEIGQLEQCLEKFSETGRRYATRTAINCKIGKADFPAVMAALDQVWQKVWQGGTPDRLADPDDTSGYGMNNAGGFVQVYRLVGLKEPKSLC